jgi:hypothetical protein
MNLIQTAVQTVLPPKRKATPSGWTSFNAPCCVHNGERADTRGRAGIMFKEDGFQYHCFNCNFKAGWTPSKLLSKNTKNLFGWLGIPNSEIQKLALYALQIKEDQPITKVEINLTLKEVELPEGTLSIIDWINTSYLPDIEEDIGKIIDYLLENRSMDLYWYNWMWSVSPGYKDRVIIPFYQDGKIVGYTGRKITDGKPKYLTHSQPGYVFNIDRQTTDRKYVIVVEGQFDAIAVDGCAISHNEPSDAQIMRLTALGREVIVVPDRDKPGAKMIETAIEQGWTVSMPDWGEGIKDVADAVKKFGRIYTLFTILHYKETNEIKKQLLKKKLEHVEL